MVRSQESSTYESGGAVHGSGWVIVRGYRERAGTGTRRVPLGDIKRFGRMRVYGDSRDWCMAQLVSGEIVHSMHKDQSADVLKLIRQRLKHVPGATGTSRDISEAFTWEDEDDSRVFADVEVGDFVRPRAPVSSLDPLYEVVEITEKRFRCRIGVNEVTKQPMFMEFTKFNGRSVGGRFVHWVTPL